MKIHLAAHNEKVMSRLEKIKKQDFVSRLWRMDPSLWNLQDHDPMLGWIRLPEQMLKVLPEIEKFSAEVKAAGYEYIVLIGMGGSSMAPIVYRSMLDEVRANRFHILDTVDPVNINTIVESVQLEKTLIIVSSKSGTTIEVLSLMDYFWEKMTLYKPGCEGENFIAITDHNTSLVKLAAKKGFRKTFINFPGVGGRYSALSYSGLVPASLMGLNVKELLKRAYFMSLQCMEKSDLTKNPGLLLGALMAELANEECNKLIYLLPSGMRTFGLWLEQLLAESTGKNGKGILPINGYPLANLNLYGKDRFFLQMTTAEEYPLNENDLIFEIRARNCNPVINIQIKDHYDLAAEFYRWEIATIVTGALMEINPFDQPNVEASKIHAYNLLNKTDESSWLVKHSLTEGPIRFFGADIQENSKLLFKQFFSCAEPGDYVSLLAFLPQDSYIEQSLLEINDLMQQNLHLPVTVQFGPRYLHSTGQFFKGGPNTGFFIGFISNNPPDVQIPYRTYTFNELKAAQLNGDLTALINNGRHALLVDLGEDPINGLELFKRKFLRALASVMVV